MPDLSPQDQPLLGRDFERAFHYANRLHARQLRKGAGTPFLVHLLSVAALVLEDGGSETEAIAALLHDAVEDQGGAPTLRAIRRRFGSEVAAIVEGCTETDISPKPPWQVRKDLYLAHLASASPSVLRVSLADKIHNARSTLSALDTLGPRAWELYNAGPAAQAWWYESLAQIFAARSSGYLAHEFARLAAEVIRQAQEVL
jgi:(p)ppGpp synthase/HD superfamily hydrolase